MIQHLENLKDLIFHPYVVALISLFIGCYLLRDIARVILYIFSGARRTKKNLANQEHSHA